MGRGKNLSLSPIDFIGRSCTHTHTATHGPPKAKSTVRAFFMHAGRQAILHCFVRDSRSCKSYKSCMTCPNTNCIYVSIFEKVRMRNNGLCIGGHSIVALVHWNSIPRSWQEILDGKGYPKISKYKTISNSHVYFV